MTRKERKKIKVKRKSRFESLIHVEVVSTNSPYWKHTVPGTIVRFSRREDALKAISDGHAKPVIDVIETDNGLLL